MPLFTIHDSITTIENYSEVLKHLMPKYVAEFTGLTPMFEEERWLEHDYQIDYENW